MKKPEDNDTFVTETFWSTSADCLLVEWNYRDGDGKLHGGMTRTEEDAVQAASLVGYVPPEDEDAAQDALLPDLSVAERREAALQLLLTLQGFDFGQRSGNVYVWRMLTAIHNLLYDLWEQS